MESTDKQEVSQDRLGQLRNECDALRQRIAAVIDTESVGTGRDGLYKALRTVLDLGESNAATTAAHAWLVATLAGDTSWTIPQPVTGITEDPRAEPLARALHPGEWWNSPNPLYAVDKDAHIAQARRMLVVVDAADTTAGIRRVSMDEAIERAAKRDFDNARTMRYGHGPTWEAAPEERRQAARNRVREIITAALSDAS